MKVTLDMVRVNPASGARACDGALPLFRRLYPHGLSLTPDSIAELSAEMYAKGIVYSIGYLRGCLLNSVALGIVGGRGPESHLESQTGPGVRRRRCRGAHSGRPLPRHHQGALAMRAPRLKQSDWTDIRVAVAIHLELLGHEAGAKPTDRKGRKFARLLRKRIRRARKLLRAVTDQGRWYNWKARA